MYSMSISLLRESPSVLFCASDGKHLRVYQVVCNAKTLLASQFSTSKVFLVEYLGGTKKGSSNGLSIKETKNHFS
jgi:hypothetical protein